MTRRVLASLVAMGAAILAACGVKLTVERHDKATIEMKGRRKGDNFPDDKDKKEKEESP